MKLKVTKTGRQGTRTSAFGSPGRANHDATSFYDSRLYEGLDKGNDSDCHSNSIDPQKLDLIYRTSSENMDDLPNNSVHLMVTSPPYNAGKEYDEDHSLKEYLMFLKRVWTEVRRVLVPGGRACINIANLGRKPYVPLHAYIINDMLELGFLMRGEIIWNKASSAGSSTAWGSWLSPANPTLRDVHEYILVFSKGTFGRKNLSGGKSTLIKEEFLEYTKSIWTFQSESARKIGHPAPFPVELPYRLAQLYTYDGEVVLDPFMGSGQTALAAIKTGRHFIGYEIDEAYVDLAQRRIKEFIMDRSQKSLGLAT
ncbi:MAG: site-specific DNA-methyltransferase [Deltaproteobacteria bacterium]|nr:site-specific DNA-methyltransferase [Deltaproteobacteria bacterium]